MISVGPAALFSLTLAAWCLSLGCATGCLVCCRRLRKRLLGLGAPDPNALRAGREALKAHLGYMNGLALTIIGWEKRWFYDPANPAHRLKHSCGEAFSPELRCGHCGELVGPRDVGTAPAFADINDLLSFLHDRLKVYLRDQGIRHDVIDACLAMPGNDDLTLLVNRAEALSAVLKTEDGANLLAGFKRANNILTQAEDKDGVEYSYGADLKFAETDAERALFTALDQAEATITPALNAEDFATAMAAMASLRAPIDAFFTDVQVNSDNPIIRRNRLNLLHRIRSVCGQVADLVKIEG